MPSCHFCKQPMDADAVAKLAQGIRPGTTWVPVCSDCGIKLEQMGIQRKPSREGDRIDRETGVNALVPAPGLISDMVRRYNQHGTVTQEDDDAA